MNEYTIDISLFFFDCQKQHIFISIYIIIFILYRSLFIGPLQSPTKYIKTTHVNVEVQKCPRLTVSDGDLDFLKLIRTKQNRTKTCFVSNDLV